MLSQPACQRTAPNAWAAENSRAWFLSSGALVPVSACGFSCERSGIENKTEVPQILWQLQVTKNIRKCWLARFFGAVCEKYGARHVDRRSRNGRIVGKRRGPGVGRRRRFCPEASGRQTKTTQSVHERTGARLRQVEPLSVTNFRCKAPEHTMHRSTLTKITLPELLPIRQAWPGCGQD